jgi:hypothetical protein
VAIGFRILCMLILVASPTGCLSVGIHEAPQGTVLPLAAPLIASNAQAFRFSHGEIPPPTLGNPGAGNSSVFLRLPAGNELSASSITLSTNADGSVSVYTNGRSASPLRGLDPSLVNPDLLPFLFPSCDVPAVPVGAVR